MRRIKLAIIGVFALGIALIAQTMPAQASGTYTGAEEICTTGGGCGSAGGVLQRNGHYYMMTVAHITTPAALGSDVYAYHPTFHYVGKLAYRSTTKDLALIDMGTSIPGAKLRISDATTFTTPPGYVIPSVAQIASVPTGADWAYYNSICTTGWSSGSTAIKTKCGYADNTISGDCNTDTCGIQAYSGYIGAANDTGASGSPVWQPKPDGTVRLLGFMSNCIQTLPCSAALFRPVYLFPTYNWSTAETLAGYPTGAGGQILL